MIGDGSMNIGFMSYDNGILTIANSQDKMFFPCNERIAGLIMESVRKAYKVPDGFMPLSEEYSTEIEKLRKVNTREATETLLDLEGWVKVGRIEDIVLYVKCLMADSKLFAFRYLSDNLPNRHGSTQVNITMDI